MPGHDVVSSLTEQRAVVPATYEPAHITSEGRWHRAGLVAYALVGGSAIFVFGTPYFEVAPTNDNPAYNAALVAAFLTLWRFLRRSPSLAGLGACSQALFVAAAAMLVMVVGPFNWLVTADDESVRQAAQDKLAQFLAVVPVIIALTWAAPRRPSWIYIQKGQPRRWVTFGTATFGVSAFIIFGIALAAGTAPSELLAAAPWVLGFVALNAVMEELWFRGIFLRPYSAELGGTGAVVVTALVFGAAHIGATYISELAAHLFFASIVVVIGIVAAWAIRWANTLWGAVLFHAGLDLVIILELVE